MRSEPLYMCPVCGLVGSDEPPYDAYGCATFTICPCCGTEFGYDDSTVKHDELRRRWSAKGMLWWSTGLQPREGWNGYEQLRKANLIT